MLNFKEHDAVLTPNGSIGMISEIHQSGRATIQLGAGGPFRVYNLSSLRWVTEEEVARAGMHGVGFNVLSHEDRVKRAKEQRQEVT